MFYSLLLIFLFPASYSSLFYFSGRKRKGSYSIEKKEGLEGFHSTVPTDKTINANPQCITHLPFLSLLPPSLPLFTASTLTLSLSFFIPLFRTISCLSVGVSPFPLLTMTYFPFSMCLSTTAIYFFHKPTHSFIHKIDNANMDWLQNRHVRPNAPKLRATLTTVEDPKPTASILSEP